MIKQPWGERLRSRLKSTEEEIARFCRRHQIRELEAFGSVLRDDFKSDSDVDLLVSFAPEARVGFLALGRVQQDLEQIFGRRVDLIPKGGVKPLIRDQIFGSAERLYAA